MALLSQAVGPLEESSNQPLYQQLQRALRDAIDRRLLAADDAIPPERDLAGEFGVSRITVRKAIDGLVSEGLLVRRHGSGTFVRGRVEKTSYSRRSPNSARGRAAQRLARDSGTVTPEAPRLARVPAPVFRYRLALMMRRWRSSAIVASCPASLDAVETSLYSALERTGNRPVRALQRLRDVLLTREQAELLRAKPGDAGLLVERLGFLQDGHAVEFSQSYYRGDTYDFVAELSTPS